MDGWIDVPMYTLEHCSFRFEHLAAGLMPAVSPKSSPYEEVRRLRAGRLAIGEMFILLRFCLSQLI